VDNVNDLFPRLIALIIVSIRCRSVPELSASHRLIPGTYIRNSPGDEATDTLIGMGSSHHLYKNDTRYLPLEPSLQVYRLLATSKAVRSH
jgi:hypothetical protein